MESERVIYHFKPHKSRGNAYFSLYCHIPLDEANVKVYGQPGVKEKPDDDEDIKLIIQDHKRR